GSRVKAVDGVSGLEHPDRRQLFHVRGVHLIQRAVAPGKRRAVVLRPIRSCRGRILTKAGRGDEHQENQSCSHRKSRSCKEPHYPKLSISRISGDGMKRCEMLRLLGSAGTAGAFSATGLTQLKCATLPADVVEGAVRL